MNIIVLFSLLFAFSELLLMLLKHSKTRTSKTRNDRGSLVLLWIIITTGFTGGFFLARPVNQFWLGFGTVLLIAGLIIRWVAVLQLGKSFTVDVAITDAAKLRTNGIYKRIRHPGYLGILMIVTGFSSLMSSYYSFLVLAIPVLLAIIYRIRVEEKVLISEFGDSYLNYMAGTKRLIPGIY
jgi:protein-S-isoprenylcysteine O-methyltransferase Ste14